MSQEEAIRIFEETGALLKGHFILRSGLRSEYFFQCAQVCQYMDKVSRLAEMLLERVEDLSFETVVAPAMGGLVIGQEVARQAGKRFIFVEKENDKLALRRNFRLAEGEKVLLVEDVITKGGRVREALAIIEEWGALCAGIGVVVDRSEGKAAFDVPCHAVVNFSFPTYSPDALPPHLQEMPPVKPGS